MSNIIAIVWDFDKTLVDGYMQDPIFEEYKVDAGKFLEEVNALPDKYMKEQSIKVNPDTIYLNHFIKYAQNGTFKGLDNEKLKQFGQKLKFYPGIPEIFEKTRHCIEDNKIYQEYDNIKVEHYIVITGMAQIIRGSSVMPYVNGIWGCELIEGVDKEGKSAISEIGYTIDNTTKTRALFEINKGVGRLDGVEVNTKIPNENRRVHFINMVYVADGPSDIPAFSVVNKNKGQTFAVYPAGNMDAMKQVDKMRQDGRVNMYAEADYREGKTAYMWLCNKIKNFADRIRDEERQKLAKLTSNGVPKHLT